MPQVSVIIPTYNRKRFVVKAIDSVLRQSFTDFEIIVIDDGSTDDTQAALEPYLNSIRLIYQHNAGVSSARNIGIRAAQGEWIAFLDSDDEWAKNYLFTQAVHIKEFPLAVAHITDAFTVLTNEKRSSLFRETGLWDRLKDQATMVFERPLHVIVKHAPWFLQSSILRREVLLNAGVFDEQLSIAEDLDVLARVSLQGPFTFCRETLVDVHRREESIENLVAQSQRRGVYRCKAFEKVYANLLACPALTYMERTLLICALSCNSRALGNVLLMANKKFEARQVYKESFSRYRSIKSLIKFAATYLPSGVSRILIK